MQVAVSQAIALFLISMWMNNVLKSVWKLVQVPSMGGVRVRAFFVQVDAQVMANRESNLLLVSVIDGVIDHEVKHQSKH